MQFSGTKSLPVRVTRPSTGSGPRKSFSNVRTPTSSPPMANYRPNVLVCVCQPPRRTAPKGTITAPSSGPYIPDGHVILNDEKTWKSLLDEWRRGRRGAPVKRKADAPPAQKKQPRLTKSSSGRARATYANVPAREGVPAAPPAVHRRPPPRSALDQMRSMM